VRVCEYGGAAEAYGGPSSRFGTTGERVTIMNAPVGSRASGDAGADYVPGIASGAPDADYVPDIGSGTPNDAGIGPWEIVTHRIYRSGAQ